MITLRNIHVEETRDNRSPVRSHESFDFQVKAICHHSGQYLTESEAFAPIWEKLINWLLREQHDFPGLPVLDRAFRQAAHASKHRHVFWSRVAFQTIALLLPLPLIIFILLNLFALQDYVPLAFWYPFLGVLGSITLGSIFFTFGIVVRYAFREIIYHRRAIGKPPMTLDYPMQGRFSIYAQEHIKINLDNIHKKPPVALIKEGKILAQLISIRKDWEDYSTYLAQYRGHKVGEFVHGGAIALENVTNVAFLDNAPEFDHRLVLRVPASRIDFAESEEQTPSMEIATSYHILPAALYPEYNKLARFPLELEPRLAPRNSRTLRLHFTWRGPDPETTCYLDSCILDVPPELGRVVKVKYGRSTQNPDQVIWRNRLFSQQTLVLEVTFEEPILECHDHLTGSFVFTYEGLLSNIKISPDRIWDARGRQIDKDHCEIACQTTVTGNIEFSLQRLSQEHEYVKPMPPIVCQSPPNQDLVRAITEVLLNEAFDLQRIMRTAPRLDPTGSLDNQLFYWDILGRRYIEELLDAVDVHIVITGSDRIIQGGKTGERFQPYTHIDLRARCLHDPRNESTPEAVKALIGEDNPYSLRTRILTALSENGVVCNEKAF